MCYHLHREMTPTTIDLAYFAGILDGEGSIGLRLEYKRSLSLVVDIGSTSPELLEWLLATFGGMVYIQRKVSKARILSSRPFAVWRIRGDAASRLLRQVQPLLKIKGLHVEIACNGWAERNEGYLPGSHRHNGGNRPSPETMAIRHGYYLAMRELNGHGYAGFPEREFLPYYTRVAHTV